MESENDFIIKAKQQQIIQIYELLACLTWIDENKNPGHFEDLSRDDENESVRRENRSHIECLREHEHAVHVCIASMKGVFSSYTSSGHIQEAEQMWFRQFCDDFQIVHDTLHTNTVGKSNSELVDQILQTREVFTIFFLTYFGVQNNTSIDKSHRIVFKNRQFHMLLRTFASWVQINVDVLRNTYEKAPESIEKEIALDIAIYYKEHWYSTYNAVYSTYDLAYSHSRK
jgi:hypothetical protein